MSCKKSKSKAKASQANLRKMMQDMKNKKPQGVRGHGYNASAHTNSRTLSNPEIMKAALKDQLKLKTLISGSKVDLNSLKRSVAHTKETLPSAKVAKRDENSKKTEKAKTSSGILLGDYGSDSEEENKEEEEKTTKMEVDDKEEEKKEDSVLPEGFFDDPVTDAKFRGVETPADVMDREYEEFQRVIQHETGHSEQIVEEDHEVENYERQIEEIDEQIACFSRVEKLNIARDERRQRVKPRKMEVAEEQEDEDEIDEEGLDWREKDAFM